jgi:hypothetical protein
MKRNGPALPLMAQFRLSLETGAWLEELAIRLGTSRSDAIRRVLDAARRQQQKQPGATTGDAR